VPRLSYVVDEGKNIHQGKAKSNVLLSCTINLECYTFTLDICWRHLFWGITNYKVQIHAFTSKFCRKKFVGKLQTETLRAVFLRPKNRILVPKKMAT